MTNSKEYLSHIDGIRAIAVIAIIAFHIDPEVVLGGYLGVDVFFVISGFLITRQIISQIDKQAFSFSEFYIRRIFRLFPALIATLSVTFLCGYYLLTPDNLERFSGALIHSIFSISNFYFYAESGYFDTASKLKPLLHTWSLSVEEQFYMIWPLILFVILTFFQKRVLFLLLFSLAALSAIAYSYFLSLIPSAVFFMMPFRLFEFAIGGLLCWLSIDSSRAGQKSISVVLSMLALIYCLMFLSHGPESSILTTLVPCLLAGLLIWSGDSPVGKAILTSGVMSFIGRISYSLYLVHWPIIVFFNLARPSGLGFTDIIILIALIIIWGWLSYKIFETPFRESAKSSKDTRKFKTLGLIPATAVIVVLSASSWANNGWPWRYEGRVELAQVEGLMDLNRFRDEIVEYDLLNIRSSTYFNRTDTKNILVVGDSHARDLAVILSLNLDSEQYEVRRGFFDDPCYAILADKELIRGSVTACNKQIEELKRSLLVASADIIIFSSFWWPDTLVGIEDGVDLVQSINTKADVFLSGRTEAFDNLPESLISHLVKGGTLSDSGEVAYSLRQSRTDLINKRLTEISTKKKIKYLDRGADICVENSCRVFDESGNLLFWDGHHFTLAGVTDFGERIAQRLLD